MFTVNNKVALITGAARGIGLDYAKVLLRNNLKAVALIDIDEINGQKALTDISSEFGKDRVIFVKADVADKVQFEQAFEVTVDTFNQLDIVINNAAIIQEIEWERCISVNLVGTILGSTLAMEKYLPKYKSCKEGVILNMSSTAGLYPYEPVSMYTATKYGIIGFSRSIGGPFHYKISNVRVVSVCPGATDTGIIQLTKKQVHEPFLSMWNENTKKALFQDSLQVAEHVVKIIENGASGSVWIISKNNSAEVTFKHY